MQEKLINSILIYLKMYRNNGETVMDPLKLAYGVKKPLEHKIDKIQELYNN